MSVNSQSVSEFSRQHAMPAAVGGMTVWYRLFEAATALGPSTWEDAAVARRMQAQELDTHADSSGPSANVRDGLHILSHIRAASASILDVGCGSGHWSRVLADAPHPFHTWNYTGVEINAERTEICRRLHPGVQFQEARAEALPFAARSFDIVLSSGVLQYVPRWRTALVEAARVAGGFVALLRIPVVKFRATTQCLQIVRSDAGEEIHYFYLFERNEWERAAAESGLRMVARDYSEECTRVEGLDERLFWLNYVFERPRD